MVGTPLYAHFLWMRRLIPTILATPLGPNLAIAGDPLSGPDEIIAMVQQRMDPRPARDHYLERQKQRPSLEGSWVVLFTLSPDGKAEDVSVLHEHRADAPLERCLVDVANSWHFEPIVEAPPVKKTLTFRSDAPPAHTPGALRIERGTSMLHSIPPGADSVRIADPTVVHILPTADNAFRFVGLEVGTTTAKVTGPGRLISWSFEVIEPDIGAAAADPSTVHLPVGQVHSFAAGGAVNVAVTRRDIADITVNPTNGHIEVTGVAPGLTDVFTEYPDAPSQRFLALIGEELASR